MAFPKRVNWIYSLVKVVGVSIPVVASLVQIQAEYDAFKLRERLRKLEDPINELHPQMGDLLEAIYTRLRSSDSSSISLEDPDYERFVRPLALLESRGFIAGEHVIGGSFKHGLRVSDPSFVLYLCALFEDEEKMQLLFDAVDSCSRGKTLRAQEVMDATGLSNPVVYAMFKSFESKGFGLISKEMGLNQSYHGKA